MMRAFEPAAIAQEAAPNHHRRAWRLLVVWLGLSLALHLTMLFGLPGFAVNAEPAKSRILDVVVQRASTPQVSAETRVKIPLTLPHQPRRDISAVAKTAEVVRHPVRRNRKPEMETTRPAVVAEAARNTYPVRAMSAEEARLSAVRTVGISVSASNIDDASPPGFHAGYLRNPPPPYPLVARRNGEQGKVILKVLVTRDGLPASVDIEKTSRSSHLDDAALETVKTWRFVPARQNGQAVEAWVLVPIVFRLEGTSQEFVGLGPDKLLK